MNISTSMGEKDVRSFVSLEDFLQIQEESESESGESEGEVDEKNEMIEKENCCLTETTFYWDTENDVTFALVGVKPFSIFFVWPGEHAVILVHVLTQWLSSFCSLDDRCFWAC